MFPSKSLSIFKVSICSLMVTFWEFLILHVLDWPYVKYVICKYFLLFYSFPFLKGPFLRSLKFWRGPAYQYALLQMVVLLTFLSTAPLLGSESFCSVRAPEFSAALRGDPFPAPQLSPLAARGAVLTSGAQVSTTGKPEREKCTSDTGSEVFEFWSSSIYLLLLTSEPLKSCYLCCVQAT